MRWSMLLRDGGHWLSKEEVSNQVIFLQWLIVRSDSFGHCLICDWSSREQRAVLPDCVKRSRGSRTRTQDTLFSPPPSFLGQHLRGNCPAQFFLRWSPRREWLPQASLRCLRPDCDTGRDRIQPGQKVDISEWISPEKCFKVCLPRIGCWSRGLRDWRQQFY